MVVIQLVHNTWARNVAGILAEGLRAHKPDIDGNWPGDWALEDQPRGVYATLDDWPGAGTGWFANAVRFHWDGPLERDPEVDDAVVIEDNVPRSHLDMVLTNPGAPPYVPPDALPELVEGLLAEMAARLNDALLPVPDQEQLELRL